MDIKYISPYWGHTHLSVDEFIKKAMDQGFDGVEINVPFDPDFVGRLQSSLQKYHAHFIAQQYLPPAIESADAYKQRMKEYLLPLNVIWIGGNKSLTWQKHEEKRLFSFAPNLGLCHICQPFHSQNNLYPVNGISISK